MKKLIVYLLLICLCLPLTGCGKSLSSERDIRVVFIPKITGNSFFDAANDGAQEHAEKNGYTVDYRGSDTARIEVQIEIVEEAIAEKVDAIVISALDPIALDGYLKKAMDAGIKVITWGSDVSSDARMLMVSQGTPEQLGTMLVEMGAKSLTERGMNPATDPIKYVWHYSREGVVDQNSWHDMGEAYIAATYPNWVNVHPENYYSHQFPNLAVGTGKMIFNNHPDIDLIICNDSTALPSQAEVARGLGLDAQTITITGFATPNAMREYCEDGTVARWGFWDCKIQGALACYLAYYLAQGNELEVGDKISVPEIGIVQIMPNSVLGESTVQTPNSGVVLLTARSEFTIKNVNDYDF